MIEKKIQSIGYREPPNKLYDMIFEKKRSPKAGIIYYVSIILLSSLFVLSLFVFKDIFPYIIHSFEVIFSIFKWKTFLPLFMVILSLIPIWISMEGVVLYYVFKK